MVLYKSLDLSVLVHEICHWYFDRNCVEPVDCFGEYRHFNDVNPSCP